MSMGYRDDLIRRLQQDGLWDQLSGQQQTRFQSLTEDQARQMMVMDDQWTLGDEETVGVFGLMALVQMIPSFKGALVEHGGENIGKLSKAGRMLAEFFLEMQQEGLSTDDIDAELRKLSPLVIAALLAAYQGPSGEE